MGQIKNIKLHIVTDIKIMSFKFNFGCGDEDEEVTRAKNFQSPPEYTCADTSLRPCRKHDTVAKQHDYPADNFNEILLEDYASEDNDNPRATTKLYYLEPVVAEINIREEAQQSISSLIDASDLESGKYEGGLKLWECTLDLLKYIHNNNNNATLDRSETLDVKGKRVLDLGCGCGVLGAYTALLGAHFVCLQDYNWEVIEEFTIPSVQKTLLAAVGGGGCDDEGSDDEIAEQQTLNGLEDDEKPVADIKESHHDSDVNKLNDKCEFLSGDWSAMCEYFTNNHTEKFDFILSSETIYNVAYYDKLRVVLNNHMAQEGVALFAAKSQYFGVGGGVCEFVSYLESTGSFCVDIVQRVDDHLQREIVQVKKKLS